MSGIGIKEFGLYVHRKTESHFQFVARGTTATVENEFVSCVPSATHNSSSMAMLVLLAVRLIREINLPSLRHLDGSEICAVLGV